MGKRTTCPRCSRRYAWRCSVGMPSCVSASQRWSNTHLGRAVVVDTAALDGHLQHMDVVLYDLASLAGDCDSSDLEHLLRGEVPVVGLERDEREHLRDGAQALGVR